MKSFTSTTSFSRDANIVISAISKDPATNHPRSAWWLTFSFFSFLQTLFRSRASVCWGFKPDFSLSEEESAGSQSPCLSQLIVLVCVCALMSVCCEEGGELSVCQLPQDAAEHVRTREADTRTKPTDTTAASHRNKQPECRHKHRGQR